jgi:hypothetical protein
MIAVLLVAIGERFRPEIAADLGPDAAQIV